MASKSARLWPAEERERGREGEREMDAEMELNGRTTIS
jgi:hypothetical protein